MGIYRHLASKFDPDDEGGKKNAAGKKKIISAYRSAPFNVPFDATREDLAKVLENLVSRGVVDREEIESTFSEIVDTTREKIRAAAESGRLLDDAKKQKLLATVKARFEKHNKEPQFKNVRKGIKWANVQAKLEANPGKLWSLNEMERTGGKPDVVWYDRETDEYVFMDCSKQCPSKRTNVCYDRKAQNDAESESSDNARYNAEFGKPAGNAVDMAATMGISILNEKEYKFLVDLGVIRAVKIFNTFEWLDTPPRMRNTGYAWRAEMHIEYGDRDEKYHDAKIEAIRAFCHGGMIGFRGSLRV